METIPFYFSYLKESPIQPALFGQNSQKLHFLGCQLVIKLFFSQKLLMTAERN